MPTVSPGVPASPERLSAPLPFEQMFEEAPMAVSLNLLSSGRILAVNRAWEALSGISRHDAIGRTTVELGFWSGPTERQAYLARNPTGSGRCLMRVMGGERHMRLQTTVIEGAEPLLLAYLLDVSHEVRAEQERDRTQAELQATNRQLQQQVELHAAIEKLTMAGHWTNPHDDDSVSFSPGLFEITGLTPSLTIGRQDGREGIHPDDLPAWREAREARDGREVEFRWTRPDGAVRWMRSRISQTAVKGMTGTDFGVVQDITVQREAAHAQAQQLQLLQNLTARVPGVVFQAKVDAAGRASFEYVSDSVREMFQIEPQAICRDGRSLFTRVLKEDQMPLWRSITAATARQVHWQSIFRVHHLAKGMRWYKVQGLPQKQTDGSVLWHGFVHDITEAREAALELDRQHRLLDAVRQAQAAYIETDDKRRAFEGLLQALLSVTDSAFGFVGEVLYDADDKPYLKTHAITNIAWDEASRKMYEEQAEAGMEFHNHHTLFGHALATGQSVISNDPLNDPRRGSLPSRHPRLRSFLGLPLALGDRLIAMVGLANAPGGYCEDDIEFLQPLLGTVRQLVVAQRGHAERQRSRQQLQATSALLAEKTSALQVTLDSMSQGLSKMDAQGRVTVYNRRLLEMLDLPEAVMSGQPTEDEVVSFQKARGDFGLDYELVEPQARRYIEDDQGPAPQRYMRRTPDGRALEIQNRPLPDGGMVRTYSDVTSYVEAEEALRDERQRLEWVLEATGPGIWELDLSSGLTHYSDRWATLLGYSLQELQPPTRETWRSLVHPDDLDRAEAQLEAHLRGETLLYDCDLRLRHKGGAWLWFNDRGQVHRRDGQGTPLYMSGTLLDIHLRVTAQEEVRALNASLEQRVAERTAALERSMRDMEVISYSIAHDLRAPLRSVNGFASLVREADADRLSPEGRLMFDRIVNASGNMGQMISDMLELLRVVRVEIEPESVDMNALARSVREALAPGVPHARVELRTLPRVKGDAKLLRQLLSNLLDNALKYSRHQASPEIELGFDATREAFYLKDNGMGFDMAHASKLFGLFQRLHAGSAAPGGTGVGLAIVARTLERHGGRIWAEAAPGQGATFWWTLPRG